MKIFKTSQVREIDKRTLEKEDITSSMLMDRASLALYNRIRKLINKNDEVLILAGPGNNGGDALSVSLMMEEAGYKIKNCLCFFDKKISADTSLREKKLTNKISIKKAGDLPDLNQFDIIIEGLFGSGLNRPAEGDFAEIIKEVNKSSAKKISIDIPGGLFGEDNRLNNKDTIIKAEYTLSLQFPKISFLLSENEEYTGNLAILDFGLNKDVIEETHTDFFYTQKENIELKTRKKFSHKGSFGKILNIAGSKGMAGAAVLSTKAALKTGAGLVTARIPENINDIIQISVPEAITSIYTNNEFWIDTDDIKKWSAISVGPGLGKSKEKVLCMKKIFMQKPEKLVIDADALNIISDDEELLNNLPENSIITPHPGEFSRLTKKNYSTGYERLKEAIEFAKKHHIFIVLKGANTAIITPEGKCHFNSTGNSGLSTAGSGDVLTGIIVSLLGQGYSHKDACITGVYIHGLSADIAVSSDQSEESLTAGDIINNIGKTFKKISQ